MAQVRYTHTDAVIPNLTSRQTTTHSHLAVGPSPFTLTTLLELNLTHRSTSDFKTNHHPHLSISSSSIPETALSDPHHITVP